MEVRRDGQEPPQPPRNRPDRRALAGVLQQLVAGPPGEVDQDTPLAIAQALMDRAFAEPNAKTRIQPAKDALAIGPDCADAYVLLAEHTQSRKEALYLCQQSLAAGERLDRDVFRVAFEHHDRSIIDGCFPLDRQFFRPILLKNRLQYFQ